MKIKTITAQKLIERNFRVFSLKIDKTPITYDDSKYSWNYYVENPLTDKQIERAANDPKAEYWAIATGHDGLEVIDVDLKVISDIEKRKVFFDEYLLLLKDHIDSFDDKIVIYKTKNFGYHLLYKCPNPGGNQKLAKLKGQKEAVIETRGVGGYVVAYPENYGSRNYLQIQRITQDERDTIIGLSAYFDYKEEENPKKEANNTGLTPWDDFNAKNTCLDVLENDFKIVRNLSDKYIIKRQGAESPHSGYIYKNTETVFLFSTGTIYPAEKLLTPAVIYAYKYCGGDLKEMAKKLYDEGYGDRKQPVFKISEEIKINHEDLNFPIEIFPEKIQQFIIKAKDTLNLCPDYMGNSLLWLISILIGNTFSIEVKKGWKEMAIVWIALVGKAGIGKTPSTNFILKPLLDKNAKEIKNYQKQHEKWERYMELSKEEKQYNEEVKKPFKNQFIVDDTTVEGLVDLHEEVKNGVGIYKDELATWIKDMNKYRAGSDMEFFLKIWNGIWVHVNRKNAKSNLLNRPFVPVLGGIQTNVIIKFLTEEFKDSGFLDRILLSLPELEVEPWNEAEMPEELLQWYNDYILHFGDEMRKLTKYDNDGDVKSHIIRFDPYAKAEWIRIFNEITLIQNSDEENEYMKSMLPKQKSYIPRFSLLLEILSVYDTGGNIKNIRVESVLGAEKLSNYYVAMAKKLKAGAMEKTEIKTLINEAKGKDKKKIFLDIIKNNPDVNKAEIAEMLNVSRGTLYNWIKN